MTHNFLFITLLQKNAQATHTQGLRIAIPDKAVRSIVNTFTVPIILIGTLAAEATLEDIHGDVNAMLVTTTAQTAPKCATHAQKAITVPMLISKIQLLV